MVCITLTANMVSTGISVQILEGFNCKFFGHFVTDFTLKNIATLFFDCICIRVNEDDATKILQANPY